MINKNQRHQTSEDFVKEILMDVIAKMGDVFPAPTLITMNLTLSQIV